MKKIQLLLFSLFICNLIQWKSCLCNLIKQKFESNEDKKPENVIFSEKSLVAECTELNQICDKTTTKASQFYSCNQESGFGYCLKTKETSCVNSRACGYGLMCMAGFCEEAQSCKKIGQGCNINTDCCTNMICHEAQKVCQPCYECRELLESCYIDSQCRGWSLHCEEGICKQCKDLVYKKNCMKYGYFCRTDDECRPNLRCYYLKFKDEYLCLGAKDFSEEEPEEYQEGPKKKAATLFVEDKISNSSLNLESNRTSSMNFNLRLKAQLLNKGPSEYTLKNFILQNVEEKSPKILNKNGNSTFISKNNSNISFLNSTNFQNTTNTIFIKKIATKVFSISKTKLVRPISAEIYTNSKSKNESETDYGMVYQNYIKSLNNSLPS